MDHRLQTPAMLHVELKGAQLPPGPAGVASSSARGQHTSQAAQLKKSGKNEADN